jgi:hypothetical protein
VPKFVGIEQIYLQEDGTPMSDFSAAHRQLREEAKGDERGGSRLLTADLAWGRG